MSSKTKDTSMAATAQHALVPKLRFPEFRDAGEWKEKKAGTLFANRVEDGEEGFPIYSVTMNDGMVQRSSLGRRVDDIAESGGNRKARKGDIVYNMMRMWQGAFGVSQEDCMVSPAYVVLSPESGAYSDFFWYLFKLPKYLQLLTSHSQGLTLDRLRLYYKDFARILVLIPSPPEQQKIADCLSSIDDLITLEARKIDALKAHKKGLMQQLFPAEGETLPKLRFPEFRDAGEWGTKELSELAVIINEKAGRNKYTLMSITSGIGLVSQLEKFGREIAGAQYNNYIVIRKNDFAYNKSATKEYPEGFIAIYSGETPAAVPNSIFTCFRVDECKVLPEYLSYLFFCNLHGRWLKNFITVGARVHGSLNIYNDDLLALPVPLPTGYSSQAEQQRIADCLSSIDDLIALQTKKLDALKVHKKGLMQQLFPSLGEVRE